MAASAPLTHPITSGTGGHEPHGMALVAHIEALMALAAAPTTPEVANQA